jgi:hypothetical protein
LYSVGELCAEEEVADAVEFDAVEFDAVVE